MHGFHGKPWCTSQVWGVYLMLGHISYAIYPRPLNVVPNKSVDSGLLSCSNYLIFHIHEYL